MNTTARIAPASVHQAVENAASAVHAIISQVTPLAEKPAFNRIRVRYGETSRRYALATQCSAPARVRTLGGCVTSRSWAIVGSAGRPVAGVPSSIRSP